MNPLEYNIFPVGDQALTLSLGNTINKSNHQKIVAMREWIIHHSFHGLLDVVLAYSSVTILYDAFAIKKVNNPEDVYSFVKAKLEEAYKHSVNDQAKKSKVVRIPVCYEEPFGLDITYISKTKNISVEEIIELHTRRTYHVYMIGFLPGFPYMAEVDEKLVVPRKERPRTKIEAGSVGIAGVQTGIYSLASPGGWQIIGRTPLTLFDKNGNPPVKLEPGDEVNFFSITKMEFHKNVNGYH